MSLLLLAWRKLVTSIPSRLIRIDTLSSRRTHRMLLLFLLYGCGEVNLPNTCILLPLILLPFRKCEVIDPKSNYLFFSFRLGGNRRRIFVLLWGDEYPLVTHDPNMLNKVTEELSWKIKSVSSRREKQNFLPEIVHTIIVQEVCTVSKYCTMKCDVQSPFSISKTKNNSPFESRHFTFPAPFCLRHYTSSCSSLNS